MATALAKSPPPSPSPPPTLGSLKLQNGNHEHGHLPNWEPLDMCSSSGIGSVRQKPARRRRRRKDASLTGTFRSWIVNHQIGISINLLLLLSLTHICFPRARQRTRTFFELSYYNPSTDQYTQGIDDFYFVAYWIVVFTGLRAGIMTYLLDPIAQVAGIEKPKAKVRFAEQAWLFLYYIIFWTLGMYIMYNTEYWFNLKGMWNKVPTPPIGGLLKWYFLVQFAFWLQQIVVVNIEERRKDYGQMFTHHIVTCALVLTSYGYYQTKVGNVILCIMDVVDFIFPAAKILKYSGFETACDFAFVVFIVVWFVTRHVLYLMICWSVYIDFPKTMEYGCYSPSSGIKLSSDGGTRVWTELMQPFLNPDGPVCFNTSIYWGFLAMLMCLQSLALVWFTMIVRVAWRVLNGNSAEDSRSDDEDEVGADEEEEEQEIVGVLVAMQPLEQVVGVEELHLPRRRAGPRTRYRKPGAHASGLSFAGHGDRKELLGRIGCDKPS